MIAGAMVLVVVAAASTLGNGVDGLFDIIGNRVSNPLGAGGSESTEGG